MTLLKGWDGYAFSTARTDSASGTVGRPIRRARSPGVPALPSLRRRHYNCIGSCWIGPCLIGSCWIGSRLISATS